MGYIYDIILYVKSSFGFDALSSINNNYGQEKIVISSRRHTQNVQKSQKNRITNRSRKYKLYTANPKIIKSSIQICPRVQSNRFFRKLTLFSENFEIRKKSKYC